MVEDTSAKTIEPAEAQDNEGVEPTVVVEDASDYEAEMAAKDAEIARLQGIVSDKDAGLKKYKAIAKGQDDWTDDADDVLTPEKVAEIARKETERTLAESDLAKALADKDEIAKKALRENAELKLALQNKPKISASQGAGADNTDPANVETLPAATVAELKGKGWSDEKIQKLRENIASGNK